MSDWRNRKVAWRRTGDGERPFEAEVNGQRWVVRVNDFPEEPFVFTLLVDGAEVESFDGWPAAWEMPPKRSRFATPSQVSV